MTACYWSLVFLLVFRNEGPINEYVYPECVEGADLSGFKSGLLAARNNLAKM